MGKTMTGNEAIDLIGMYMADVAKEAGIDTLWRGYDMEWAKGRYRIEWKDMSQAKPGLEEYLTMRDLREMQDNEWDRLHLVKRRAQLLREYFGYMDTTENKRVTDDGYVKVPSRAEHERERFGVIWNAINTSLQENYFIKPEWIDEYNDVIVKSKSNREAKE